MLNKMVGVRVEVGLCFLSRACSIVRPQSPLSRQDATKQTLQHALALICGQRMYRVEVYESEVALHPPGERQERTTSEPERALACQESWSKTNAKAESVARRKSRGLSSFPRQSTSDKRACGSLFAKSGGASQPARWGEVKLKPRFDAEKATHKVLNNQFTDVHKDVWAF